jgi:hypothetical protein
MALPLFIRKLMAPVEVKLVLSAFSEEVRQLKDDPKRALAGGIATDIVTPKVVDNIFGFAKQISRDIHNGRPPRVIALFLMMNVVRNYLASGGSAIWAGIYRGMNSLSMQGRALYGLNAYCLDELTKLGEMTPEEKIAALRATNEDIGAVG